ncbi:hypothetical protein Cgig2_023430 [Carnegiea gigantea]|uniref:(+)-delta-cadinene synthase n=1 Tax=Carnegiea gigantea TaxID=171969 RepID=A0A9Q1K4H1_9CARY|nr:hypothetical protein Cgig2_023430 [Carnegiea gigantea]
MENSAGVAGQNASSKEIKNCPLAQYHPDLWGDHFLNYTPPPQDIICQEEHELDELKKEVRKKLLTTMENPKDKLGFIDAIERLGVAYHLEEEIRIILQEFHDNYNQKNDLYDDDLYYVSLRFRLLRQHSFYASGDIFTKFKDGKNSFKDGLMSRDVQDLLSLYEATYLRVHGEDILEEALEVTKTKLEEWVPHLAPSVAKQVLHALSRPMRKALPRMYAREFMSFYQEDEFHDQVLLKFAKLDFNILQRQHLQELSIVSRYTTSSIDLAERIIWWKKVDVAVNFPFARDRLPECYFWMVGVYYEPQYALGRKFVTKLGAMTIILDDFFDNVSGIQAELELFTQAIQRWDINAMDGLPKYMKIWFQELLEVYDEMAEELATIGRSSTVSYAKNAMKDVVKTYHEESKWLPDYQSKGLAPTMEEYMKIAFDSTTYPMLTMASFIGMGEIATEQDFDWLIGKPQMLRAACLILRFMADIASHQFEQQRQHIPSAVECMIQANGLSEEEACRELNKQVEDAWKDLNAAFFDPQSPPMPFLSCVLNFARVAKLLYKVEDGFTNAINTKRYLVLLLVDPVQVI